MFLLRGRFAQIDKIGGLRQGMLSMCLYTDFAFGESPGDRSPRLTYAFYQSSTPFSINYPEAVVSIPGCLCYRIISVSSLLLILFKLSFVQSQ